MSKEKPHINLKDIPKQEVYKVPEGYFDSLPGRVEQQITEEKNGRSVRFTNWNMIGYAVAASISLLIVALIVFRKDPASHSAEDLLAEVSTSDLVAYLQNSEVDAYEIVDATHPDVWAEPLADSASWLKPKLNSEDMDLLYERYGVSPDENLQLF